MPNSALIQIAKMYHLQKLCRYYLLDDEKKLPTNVVHSRADITPVAMAVNLYY